MSGLGLETGHPFDDEEALPYKLNGDRSVVVSTDLFWMPMKDAPRGVKMFLLGAGHSATVGEYHGDPFWVGWFPIPRIPKELL